MQKRKMGFILVIIMLALMQAGCGHTGVDTEARMAKAKELLEERYGESFVVTEYLGDNIRYKVFNVEAYASAYPGLLFEATVDTQGNGMRDYYVAKRVSVKATEAVEKVIGDMEAGHYVHVEALDRETTLTDPDTSIESFMEENKKKEFMVYLYLDEGAAETDEINAYMAKIAQRLDCASGYIVLFHTDQEKMEEVKVYVDTQRSFYGSYQDMTKEDLVGSYRFENGVMTTAME